LSEKGESQMAMKKKADKKKLKDVKVSAKKAVKVKGGAAPRAPGKSPNFGPD
jgi:hypothetical protein